MYVLVIRSLRIQGNKISMSQNWSGKWLLSWILKRVENSVFLICLMTLCDFVEIISILAYLHFNTYPNTSLLISLLYQIFLWLGYYLAS